MVIKRYKINRRVIADLKTRSSIGLIFYILLVAIVVFTGGYFQRNLLFATVFFYAVLGICLFRFFQLIFWKKISRNHEVLNNSIFITSVGVTSLIWGLGFAVFMAQPGEYESKFLMATCTVGLCSGGAVAFIPERKLSFVFIIFMMLPAFFFMLFKGTNPSLAIMILMYFGYMIMLAHRGNVEYWDALENEMKLKYSTRELKKLSQTDVLTNIFNRRYFDEFFDFEWKRASREKSVLTLVICDLDLFKTVNDTFGHLAGDEYLKKTASILKNVFKRYTDIVARYGGEEFIILLPGVDTDKVIAMAEEVRLTIESTGLVYNEEIIKTTISFGLTSCIPNHKDTKDKLISSADKALYLAKKEGRNRVKVCK